MEHQAQLVPAEVQELQSLEKEAQFWANAKGTADSATSAKMKRMLDIAVSFGCVMLACLVDTHCQCVGCF